MEWGGSGKEGRGKGSHAYLSGIFEGDLTGGHAGVLVEV